MFHHQFSDFLNASPTPYHAAKNLANLLSEHGFQRLREDQSWDLQAGGAYFYTRSDASLVAFRYATDGATEVGVRIVGAHTDSPCLKVKPVPEKTTKGYQQLGIEVYGGALFNPWFDRDLSLAGKVCFSTHSGELQYCLVDFQEAIALLPSLAIHLDREVNKNKSVNPQTEMNPILGQGQEDFSLSALLVEHLQTLGYADVAEVLSYDLSFYDTQAAAVVGLRKEFFAGARLDNLLSCYIGTRALIDSNSAEMAVMICNDHEEVGSQSEAGAQGTLLDDLLVRLFPDAPTRQMVLRRSLMLSVDNAHGVHPNYVSRHDDNHGPILNQGPVIKSDANQGYATSASGAAFIKQLGKIAPAIPLQQFVMRADMRCGSTIGPITAAGVGVKTVDIGVPTFAMHSIRELAGCADMSHLLALLTRFYQSPNVALYQQ